MTRPGPFLTLQTALLRVLSASIFLVFVQNSSFAQQTASTKQKFAAWAEAARAEGPPTGDQFKDVFLACAVHGLRPTLEGYPIVGGRIAELNDDELIDVYRRWSGAAVEQSMTVAGSATEMASDLSADSVAKANEVSHSVTERASGLIQRWRPNGNDDENGAADEQASENGIEDENGAADEQASENDIEDENEAADTQASENRIEDEGAGLIDYAAFIEKASALLPDFLSMDALQELSSDAVDGIAESETMATVEDSGTVSYAFAYQMIQDPDTCMFVVQEMIVDISVVKIVGGLMSVWQKTPLPGDEAV